MPIRETLAAVLLILAFLAFVYAIIGLASWLFIRFERWALDRGWIEEEEKTTPRGPASPKRCRSTPTRGR